MIWVGLTGGIATGKSTVATILRELGHPVIDADELARRVTQPDSPLLLEIKNHFGDEAVDADGHLNRKYLASVVF